MRLLCAAAILLLAAIVIHDPVGVCAADSKEFKDGWNTWATAKKGDWAEYSFTSGIAKRYEVTTVDGEDITIKITLTPIDAIGRPADPVEYKPITQKWNKIELVGGYVAKGGTWSAKKVRAGNVDLDCDEANWRLDGTTFGLVYCKAVPCGGVVSASTAGKETIWLSAWGRDGKESGRIEKSREKPVVAEVTVAPAADPLMRWRAKGNYWVIKTTSTKPAAKETYTRTEVTDLKDDEATYLILTFDKDMKEIARRDGLKIRLRSENGVPTAAGQTEEDVECKGLGRISASRSDIAGAGLKSTLWTWRGIVVRSVAQGLEIDSQSELWETNLK